VSSPTPWIKASKSADNNACVELRSTGQAIELRDSKHQAGLVLTFTSAELDAWIDGAKRGEFDGLL
jgi:hypothetical protein